MHRNVPSGPRCQDRCCIRPSSSRRSHRLERSRTSKVSRLTRPAYSRVVAGDWRQQTSALVASLRANTHVSGRVGDSSVPDQIWTVAARDGTDSGVKRRTAAQSEDLTFMGNCGQISSGGQGVAGSNPVSPTKSRGSIVEAARRPTSQATAACERWYGDGSGSVDDGQENDRVL